MSSDKNGHIMFELGHDISSTGLGFSPDEEPGLTAKITCPEEKDCTDNVLTFEIRYIHHNNQSLFTNTRLGYVVFTTYPNLVIVNSD